jgi:hypothetical protein
VVDSILFPPIIQKDLHFLNKGETMKQFALIVALALSASTSFAGECVNGTCSLRSRVANVTKEVVRVPVNVTRRTVRATTNVVKGVGRVVRDVVR